MKALLLLRCIISFIASRYEMQRLSLNANDDLWEQVCLCGPFHLPENAIIKTLSSLSLAINIWTAEQTGLHRNYNRYF